AAQPCRAPKLDHGYFVPEQPTYAHESTLTYACDSKHKPAVEYWWAKITCQNGTWSPKPQCIDEKACFAPTIPNANYTKNQDGWYENEEKIRITCDKGYESKNNDATAVCTNGTWSSVPVCEKSPLACGEPPQIPHAVLIHQGYQEVFAADSEVQYECEDGYTVEGAEKKKNIFCISGAWTEGPTCIDRCGSPPEVLNGLVEKSLWSLTYRCSVYYKLMGPETVVCYSDGTWSEVPTCEDEKACFAPTIPNANYAKNQDGWYANEVKIRITCDAGYESKNNDATAVCWNGAWSSVPVCEKSPLACGEPPQIPHAVLIHQGYQEVFAADSEVQYECEDGYTVEGAEKKKNIFCISGAWTEGPTCNRFCPVNTDENHHLKPVGVRYIKYGETMELECKDEYMFDNFSVAQCIDGRLTVSRSQSEAQPCRAPKLDHGYFVPEQTTYAHESTLTYACDSKHKPAVEYWWAKITCQNGTWSPKPQCIAEKACFAPTIPNANYTKNKDGWYANEDKVRITCDKGYESKNNDATAVCTNGTWSSVPVCEKSPLACGVPPQIPHAVIIRGYQEVFAVDSEVWYKCKDGYTIGEANNQKSIFCISGNWTAGPVCSKWTVC
ncbi:Complement factor H, partial [Nibea albiflora]